MKELCQLLIVILCCGFRFLLCADAVNILHWNWHLRQKGLSGHPEIAVRMVWRHASLITEENMDAVPGQFLVFVGEKEIDGARCDPAGEGNREPATLLNAGFRQAMKFLCRH